MISIATLRAAGLTDAEILKVLETEQQERLAAVREQNRIRQRNYRARNAVTRDVRDQRDMRDDILTKEVSKEEAIQEKKESKKVRTSLHEIPPDWRPNQQHADLCAELHVPLGEVEAVFRDSLGASGKLYANHDFAFNTYIRNFNKFNKGNGNERARTSGATSSDNIIAGFGRVFGSGDRPVAGGTPPKIPRGKTEFDL